MPCPICGANCVCKNRGPEGQCCSCHKHKMIWKLTPREKFSSERNRASWDEHAEWYAEQQAKYQGRTKRKLLEKRGPQEPLPNATNLS